MFENDVEAAVGEYMADAAWAAAAQSELQLRAAGDSGRSGGGLVQRATARAKAKSASPSDLQQQQQQQQQQLSAQEQTGGGMDQSLLLHGGLR
jgi:hypothetical protein